ncbi:alpha/beta hydrolase [Halorubrum saccharovorum]|uniref:alpha/beta hydrolase n=1 Tax=Halorubrum saccharovorum TaxID=2248 RepID=UPI0009B5CD92|nr:phospholipase [Halorubrum saccharovorum]
MIVHGRGGTAEGLLRIADEFSGGRDAARPERGPLELVPGRSRRADRANEPALTSAADCVAATLDAAGDIGIGPKRVVLVGVSQGGAVVSEFLRRRPGRYGGAFVVSAALPGEDLAERSVIDEDGAVNETGLGDLAGTPVALDSSEDDPYVPVERVRATADVFRRGGASVDLRIDEGDGHGLSDATMARIGERIAELLADDSALDE